MALTQEQINIRDGFLAAKASVNAINAVLPTKADLVGGKVSTAQIPDLGIVQFLGTVASQSAMLALVGQQGDWCIRSDDGKVYLITATPSSTLANWQSLSYPATATPDNFSYANAYNAA